MRLQVLERDNYTCQIHGRDCIGNATEVDHINNVAADGDPYDPSNLRASCEPCNAAKGRHESAIRRRTDRRSARHPGTRENSPGML
ncbi:HNH endonuclease [Williamsia muralis]